MKRVMLVGSIAVLGMLVLAFAGLMLKLAADSRGLSVSLGVVDGRLSDCPSTPNCVSSDAARADSHYITPIVDSDGTRWAGIVDKVSAMPGAALVERRANYVYFTFTTGFWRFVDDVEFHYRPQTGEIAVRSGSRVGRSDWNANRDRLESIRAALN